MSQQDNFVGGFLLGTLVGGVIGGVIGAVAASRQVDDVASAEGGLNANSLNDKSGRRHRFGMANGRQDMEGARRSLEGKIAQLNDAIDDVRHQLGHVNQTGATESEGRPSVKEP